MSEYAAGRENALAAAFPAERCHDYEAALQIYLKVLESYPNDARALNAAGQAAVRAGHLDESIPLFRRALANSSRVTWSLHISLMQDFIQLGRWQDFETERLTTRKASLAGDSSLPPENGYTIDTLGTGNEFIRVIEFPTLHGKYRTRDRFLLYEEKDPCTGFTPYIDLESDDVDQVEFAKQHPDRAAAGDRSFSLDAYPTANSQGLLKFYPDGEPTYQTVRADVLARMKRPLTVHYNPGATCPDSAVPPQSQTISPSSNLNK
jgi:tetratricopeptide (TPR) repeat protein